jgi:hypothetical protein
MFKGKFVVLSLIAAALLCWQILPTSVDTVNSGVVEPCSSTASSAGGCYMVCPAGDGDVLSTIGATISIVVNDNSGSPIPGIPAADIWLVGCGDALILCGGGGAINADSATNSSGATTISGALAAGGCDSVGVMVVVQGAVIQDVDDLCNDLCLAIVAPSPDITGDLLVDLVDLSEFAKSYQSPPHQYLYCKDYDCKDGIDLVDFSLFAQHYLDDC